MKRYVLFDAMAPDGDLYEVDEETGETWMVNPRDERDIPAFVVSATILGTTQFEQLADYASKYGRLEEV